LTTSYVVVFSKQIRCQLADFYDLKKVNSTLFVDPDMPQGQTVQISRLLVEARQRVAQFYGDAQVTPARRRRLSISLCYFRTQNVSDKSRDKSDTAI
jgi:hypothetical protein